MRRDGALGTISLSRGRTFGASRRGSLSGGSDLALDEFDSVKRFESFDHRALLPPDRSVAVGSRGPFLGEQTRTHSSRRQKRLSARRSVAGRYPYARGRRSRQSARDFQNGAAEPVKVFWAFDRNYFLPTGPIDIHFLDPSGSDEVDTSKGTFGPSRTFCHQVNVAGGRGKSPPKRKLGEIVPVSKAVDGPSPEVLDQQDIPSFALVHAVED